MGRNYVKITGPTRRSVYPQKRIEQALAQIRSGNMSYRVASITYGIDNMKLYRANKNLHNKPIGGQTVLSSSEEKLIVDKMIIAAEWGFPLDQMDLRCTVKAYMDRKGATIKIFSNNMPGKEWTLSFLKRHADQLSTRVCENIKRSRSEVSADDINKYFDNLSETLLNVSSAAIVNYDETNFVDDPGKRTFIVRRGMKRPERIMDSTKGATSVMMSCAADGTFLPPYVVFKAQHLYDTWTVGGPDATRYNRSKSGWFDMTIFEDWFSKIVLPYMKKFPANDSKVIIGDNLASHLSVLVIKECEKHNIRFVFLPPNSTHLTQPLDVSVFRPLKRAWRTVLEQHKLKNPGPVSKDCFPKILKETLNQCKAKSKDNIRNGFQKCGILPFDRSKVLVLLPPSSISTATQPESCNTTSQNIQDSFVEMLKQKRFNEREGRVKRRRRIACEPGTSAAGAVIDHEDDVEMNQMPETPNDDVEMDLIPETLDDEDEFRVIDEYDLKLGDFLLVRVQTESGTTHKNFVCQIIDEEELHVKFLRNLESGNFRFPD